MGRGVGDAVDTGIGAGSGVGVATGDPQPATSKRYSRKPPKQLALMPRGHHPSETRCVIFASGIARYHG